MEAPQSFPPLAVAHNRFIALIVDMQIEYAEKIADYIREIYSCHRAIHNTLPQMNPLTTHEERLRILMQLSHSRMETVLQGIRNDRTHLESKVERISGFIFFEGRRNIYPRAVRLEEEMEQSVTLQDRSEEGCFFGFVKNYLSEIRITLDRLNQAEAIHRNLCIANRAQDLEEDEEAFAAYNHAMSLLEIHPSVKASSYRMKK